MLTLTTELFFEQEQSLFLHPHLHEASSVLDIGCGNGAYLQAIKEHYPHLNCTGLEKDEQIYRFAAQRNQSGLQFIHADYRDMMNLSAPFDIVIARLVVQHLPDLGHFFTWLSSVTHEASKVIIIDLNDDETFPVPVDSLPLFQALFRASRKPILERHSTPLLERLLAASSLGRYESVIQPYRIGAEQRDIKPLMHRYMQTVTFMMQNGQLSDERKGELEHWLIQTTHSYQIGMTAMTLQQHQEIQFQTRG